MSDFEKFMQSESKPVPVTISKHLLQVVKKSLHPSAALVFRKLMGVHLISGFLTLLVCPQYGIGPLGGGDGIMHFVMGYGYTACALFCGSIFLGTSALLAQFFLRREELRVIYRAGIWQFAVLGVGSVALMMVIKGLRLGEIPAFDPYYFGVWLGGGVGGAYLLHILLSQLRAIRYRFG